MPIHAASVQNSSSLIKLKCEERTFAAPDTVAVESSCGSSFVTVSAVMSIFLPFVVGIPNFAHSNLCGTDTSNKACSILPWIELQSSIEVLPCSLLRTSSIAEEKSDL